MVTSRNPLSRLLPPAIALVIGAVVAGALAPPAAAGPTGLKAAGPTGLETAGVAGPRTGGTPAAAGTTAGTPAPTGRPATVTLITGDRVTVTPRPGDEPAVTVDPAPGRDPGFRVRTDHTGVTVIPLDVAALVPDVLDPSLFDVSGMIAMGYDDASAATLPVIVRHAAGVRALAASSPLESGRSLASIGAESATLAKSAAPAFGERLSSAAATGKQVAGRRAAQLGGADKIWLDRRMRTSDLDTYLQRVHAAAAWESGLDGTGVTVAVLDTGIDAGHPALAGAVTGSQNFTDEPSVDDGNGHGTHVASLIVGNGAGSDGARHGLAPKANLLVGKVLGADGRGLESDVIAGMQWAAAQGADVVNVSLGAPATGADDPAADAVDQLTADTGTLFVIAAGNDGGLGPTPYTIGTPGTAAAALTVAATQDNDVQAFFSSEGPTRGSYRLKPDIAAPGINVLGAKAGARDGELYLPMSGTSQATPIVAGAAVLLLQQHPTWTPAQLKTRLTTTADTVSSSQPWTVGGGRLNLENALSEGLSSDSGALDFGYLKHPDESEQSRTVKLTNNGDTPMTLTATDQQTSESGKPAPKVAVTVSPETVTVPAGGSAPVTVRLDPEVLDDGGWQGYVSFATADRTELRLPLSVYDEPPRYDVTISILDRDGKPYDPANAAAHAFGEDTVEFFDGDTGGFRSLPIAADGTVSARIEPGRYSMMTRVVTPLAGGGVSVSIVGSPQIDISKDTALTFDARAAQQLTPPTIAGQATDPTLAWLTYRRSGDGVGWTESLPFDPAEVVAGRIFVTPSQPVAAGAFEAVQRWRLEPVGTIRKGQPDAYELVQPSPRLTPQNGPLTSREIAQLARVTDTYHGLGTAGEYFRGTVHRTTGTPLSLIHRRYVDAPTTETDWMTAEPDVQWSHCTIPPGTVVGEQCSDPITYAKGEATAVVWDEVLQPNVRYSERSQHTFQFQAGAGDGLHIGGLGGAAVESNKIVLRDKAGTLLAQSTSLYSFLDVAPEVRDFVLTQKLVLTSPMVARRFTQFDTRWKFYSAPPTNPALGGATRPPLIDVDYTPAVNALGLAAPGKPLTVDLRFRHLAGADVTGRIATATGSWTANAGRTWVTPTLKRLSDNTFRITVPKNAVRAGGSLSFKVQARDAEGNTVTQTVMDLVPVK